MANVVNGNTIYIDATGALTSVATKVYFIVVTATSANAVIVLQDNGTGTDNKCDLRVATSGESKRFDFSSNPLYFPNGIKVGTLTNAKATVVKSNGV